MASSETPELPAEDQKPPTAKSTISAMTIKLPSFYVNDPKAWFTWAEAQFGICAISQDKTTYWYVLASLDAETLARATRVVREVKSGEKYAKLEDSSYTPSAFPAGNTPSDTCNY